MGILEKIATALGPAPRNFNVLLIGLDNSGKTTLVKSLQSEGKPQLVGQMQPTIGVQVEKVKLKNCILHISDMSGQGKYRAMWERCFAECHAIVFVVDSTDRMRIAVAKDEFEGLMEHQILKDRIQEVAFLIVVNKKSQPGAMPAATVAQLLELERHLTRAGRTWHIQATELPTGEGVQEAFNWLVDLFLTAPILKAHE